MAVTNYMTVNGQIRSEHRSGEANSRDYVHDALGNVVAVFQNDWPVAMASYDPFGEFMTNWNMSGYKFTWNGGHGYRQTGLEWSSTYVRARHYSFMDGSWTTRDPLWPQEMPYAYVNGWVLQGYDNGGYQFFPVGGFGGALGGNAGLSGVAGQVARGGGQVVKGGGRGGLLPKGWEVVQGGRTSSTGVTRPGNIPWNGEYPFPPSTGNMQDPNSLPQRFPQSPNPYPPYDGCPEREYRRYCDDLHDWYKKRCGSGVYGPRPGNYKPGRARIDPTYNLYALKRQACECCFGRKVFIRAGCNQFVNPVTQTNLVRQMRDACRICRSWKFLQGPFQDPTEPLPQPPQPPAPVLEPGQMIA